MPRIGPTNGICGIHSPLGNGHGSSHGSLRQGSRETTPKRCGQESMRARARAHTSLIDVTYKQGKGADRELPRPVSRNEPRGHRNRYAHIGPQSSPAGSARTGSGKFACATSAIALRLESGNHRRGFGFCVSSEHAWERTIPSISGFHMRSTPFQRSPVALACSSR